MMRRAQDDEIVWLMPPTLGTRLNMMQVDERSMPTSRHPAAATIATQDMAPERRRNRLRGALEPCGCVATRVVRQRGAHVGGRGWVALCLARWRAWRHRQRIAHVGRGLDVSHVLSVTACHLEDGGVDF